MLKLHDISFSYVDKPTLEQLSFSVSRGEILAVIGESGCGKSTLLKLIYGMYDLNEGEISYNEKPIFGPKFNLIPGADFIKYLAQDFDLMPYITVQENVGKFLSNTNKRQKNARIAELLRLVEMEAFADVKAQYLSGGQMQRVAIARVLAREPEVLLLDEPFSHIDSFRRNTLSRKLFEWVGEKKITCIVATHDSADVLSFADQVIILKDGKITQSGNPKSVYNHPNSHYTASFFGDVNQISGSFFEFKDAAPIFVYPHELKIVDSAPLQATISRSYFRGSHYLVAASYPDGNIFFAHHCDLPANSVVHLALEDRSKNLTAGRQF